MTRWKVGLSNGQTVTEGVSKKGELSPWLTLQQYLADNNLTITSLSLIHGSRTFNLPSLGNNPKFRAFYSDKKPVSYNFGRVIGVSKNEQDVFARIQAIYEHVTLELWVDENRPDNCWVNITDSIKKDQSET